MGMMHSLKIGGLPTASSRAVPLTTLQTSFSLGTPVMAAPRAPPRRRLVLAQACLNMR